MFRIRQESDKVKTLRKKFAVRSGLLVCAGAVALVLASACQVIKMHRPVLQQGNLITQTMVDELKPGMTKEQVAFVLGRPVHLNTFNTNHWDYIYTLEDREGERVRKHLSVTFENEKLVEIGGDFAPGELTDSEEGGGEIQTSGMEASQ